MINIAFAAAILWGAAICAGQAAQIAPVLEFTGKGVQIYRCAPKPPGFAWTLQAPEAQLLDAAGKPAGRHYAGPSWQGADGSTIQGKPVAAGSQPGAGAIPWLVVQVTSHTGAGIFADIAYVVRSHTTGGVAPAAGCDARHQDGGIRVPYTATYIFFPAK